MRAVSFVELVDLREEEISVLLRGIRVRVKCRYVGVVVSFLVRGGVEEASDRTDR
jgi:hypothetical protein